MGLESDLSDVGCVDKIEASDFQSDGLVLVNFMCCRIVVNQR